jgi:type II secretory pathway component PulM
MKQLSLREKVLLSVLVIAAVCALFYYFAFQPQFVKIAAIKEEIKSCRQKTTAAFISL